MNELNLHTVEDDIVQPHPSTVIWRYMDFEKFVSLLRTSSLFFCQAKRFQDPYEGSATFVDVGIADTELEKLLRDVYDAPNGWRSYTAVNCWHMDEYESSAMWNLYLKENKGVAIRTTIKKLVDSFVNIRAIGEYSCGAITYATRMPSPTPGNSKGQDTTKLIFFHKRPEYAHEREYRVIIHCRDLKQIHDNGGVFVPVNLTALLEKIYIAPKQPSYIRPLVESILEKYGLNVQVIQSGLDTKPNY